MNPAKIASIVMLVALTFGAGLEVNRAHLAATLKNAGLLARAFTANFILVPVFGIFAVRVLHVEPSIATGILLMAIAPGVPFILVSIRKKGGTMALAVTEAFLFPLISVLTIPLTAQLVLPADAQRLPLGQFLITLVVFQVLPLAAGVVFAERAPELAEKLIRPVRIVFFAGVLALFVLLWSKLVHGVATVYGSNGMWAMLVIVVLSAIAGYLLGGPQPGDRRTLSMGTALRNISLAALIATSSFEPSVVAAVLTYFLVQFVFSTLLGIVFGRMANRTAVPEHAT